MERHPERRLRSAYAAFEERELPILKEENPGLRLSQLKNMLQKMVCVSLINIVFLIPPLLFPITCSGRSPQITR